MYSLTRDQKVENLKELLQSKERKKENLTKEISDLKNKIARMTSNQTSSNSRTQTGKILTSTPLEYLPERTRDDYKYDPTAPAFDQLPDREY